jgi:hypothetical protein
MRKSRKKEKREERFIKGPQGRENLKVKYSFHYNTVLEFCKTVPGKNLKISKGRKSKNFFKNFKKISQTGPLSNIIEF